jgi:hypothetical protein
MTSNGSPNLDKVKIDASVTTNLTFVKARLQSFAQMNLVLLHVKDVKGVIVVIYPWMNL